MPGLPRLSTAGFVLAIALFTPCAAADSSGEVVMESPGGLRNSGCIAVKSRYVSHICMNKVTVRWKIGTLLGEPTIGASASWELWSRIGLRSDNVGGSPDLMRPISTLDPATQAAIRKLRPIQLQFGATVGMTESGGGFRSYGSRIGANAAKIRFDAGRMTLAGAGFSYNTTGSPGWDKLFFRSAASTACPATMAHTASREEPVAVEEAKQMLQNDMTLSSLVICRGEFTGLSELDSVLGATCDAWLPSTQAHRECTEKKIPGKELSNRAENKTTGNATARPLSPARLPTPRLDNRQLAILDRAVQRSVESTTGSMKVDALERALAPKSEHAASGPKPPSLVMIGRDQASGPRPSGGASIPSGFVGKWRSIDAATHRRIHGRVAFLRGLHCNGGAIKLTNDAFNPLSAGNMECRTDCSLAIDPEGRFVLAKRFENGEVCEARGSMKADANGMTGQSDDGCLQLRFRPFDEKDNPYKPDRNGWLPSWAARKIEQIRRAHHLEMSAYSPRLIASNTKERAFMKELETAARSKRALCGGESKFETDLKEVEKTFVSR